MNLEDIDIDVTCLVRLRPRIKPSSIEQIEIDQEEIRINYYLGKYADQIAQALKTGKKFNMINFMEANNGTYAAKNIFFVSYLS